VVVKARPTTVAANNGPICSGETLQLTATDVPGGTYSWNGPNNFTSTLQNPTVPNAQTTNSGNYCVTVTLNGCTSTPPACTNAEVRQRPTTTASNGGPICAGQTLQLFATDVTNGSYSWTGPNNFSSNLQNPTVPNATVANAGQYCVTVTVAGCTSPQSCTVAEVRPVPGLVASTGGPVCIGGTLQLNATTVPGASCSWTGPNNFTSTLQNPSIPNAQPANAGQYCVTVTVNGCTSPQSCTNAVVAAPPTCTITGPATLIDGTTAALCGPTGNYSYSWSTGATTRCISVGPGSYSLQITDLATGCQSTPCTFNIGRVPCVCIPGYPDKSNRPRSSLTFDEQHVLQAFSPTTCPTTDSLLKVWYNDEASALMGARRVIVKTSSGTTTTDYPVTPNPAIPGCVWLPKAGSTALTGDQAGTDRFGRPLYPALFVTDITDDPTSRSGDWQQNPTVAYPPTKICGRWKAVVRTLDKTVSPPKVTITLDSDQPKNNWTLGTGSDTPPGGFTSLLNEGYGAEAAWDLKQLPFVPGRTYRAYFLVQDGDQTKTNGDAAQGCFTVHVPVTVTTSSTAAEAESAPIQPAAGTGAEGLGDLPKVYELMQNYPNPFFGATTIRYALPERSEMSVRVFTILGQEVATLVSGTVKAGYHSFEWKAVDRLGKPLPPGVYMYRMQARSLKSGEYHSMKKMILIK
jgi:hypothetical protein